MNNKYYLESEETGKKVLQIFDFDKQIVKDAIIEHLRNNITDTLYWYKVDNSKKYVGDDLITTYSMNRRNEPSLEIYKGNKLFFKPLN